MAAKRSTRLPLSRRYVEDLLQKDGIRISHETVRYWWNRFGPMFSSQIQKGLAGSLRVLTRNYQRPRISCERELGPRPTPTATCPRESVLSIQPWLDFSVSSEGYAGSAVHRALYQEARKRSLEPIFSGPVACADLVNFFQGIEKKLKV